MATAHKKRTTTRKSTRSRASAPAMASFRVAKDTLPFTHTKPTIQTLYWVILLAVIVIGQLLILKTQIDISRITELFIAP